MLPDTPVTLGQMRDLLGPNLTLLLSIDPHHLRDVALDVRLQVGDAAGDLALGEVAVPAVNGPELAPVDGNAGALQHADPAAQLHELSNAAADAGAVVTPEVGDGLVIRDKAAGQPHQLDVPPGFAFQPSAGWDPVQIAVDEQLKQHGRMISGSPRPRRRRSRKSERRQIEFINKQINHPNQVILANPVFKTIWEKSRLSPRSAFDETRHADLPPPCLSLP